MFFLKPSKLTVDFFTTDPIVPAVNTPRRATKDFPDWWSAIPKEVHKPELLCPLPTMKMCTGLTDYFSNSVCVPMWCDLVIDVGPIGSDYYRYQYADHASRAEAHSEFQRGDFLPDAKYQHVKLMPKWRAKTKQNVNWVLSQPTWCFEHPSKIIIPPGVLNFSWQSELNTNLFIPRLPNVNNKIFIKAGQPLCFITPMTERRVDLRFHRVSEAELSSLARPKLFFIGAGARIRKCPVYK
jgi:hypothetical protein